MFTHPVSSATSPALDRVEHRGATRRWTARLSASIAAGALALTLVACSSGSSAASSSTSTSSTPTATVTSTAVIITNSTAVQTSTMTATRTAVVTSTSVTTRTRDHTDTSTSSDSNTTAPTPGPIPCPGSQTLTALLASGDQSVPVSDIACSGEWAIGTYSQAGRNQVVGIFHYGTADGHWGLYPRTTACAAAVNLPPSLYKQACTTS